jgi:hypothetical protein
MCLVPSFRATIELFQLFLFFLVLQCSQYLRHDLHGSIKVSLGHLNIDTSLLSKACRKN